MHYKTSYTILIVLASIALVAALNAVLAFIVMLLWNNLVTQIFNVPTLSFWMSWGIMFLCSILFGRGVRVTTKRD